MVLTDVRQSHTDTQIHAETDTEIDADTRHATAAENMCAWCPTAGVLVHVNSQSQVRIQHCQMTIQIVSTSQSVEGS